MNAAKSQANRPTIRACRIPLEVLKRDPTTAAMLHEHWIRRLTGVCVACGHDTKKDYCPKCGAPTVSSVTMLESLHPKTELIKHPCPKCQKIMTFQAGFILSVVKRTGSFRPNFMCRQCQRQKKEALKTPQPEKVVAPIAPIPEKASRPQPSTQKRPRSHRRVVCVTNTGAQPEVTHCLGNKPLSYRPFSALKTLEIEKRG